MASEWEIRKAWQREQAYHRRLLRIAPLAAVVVFSLFLMSDQVSVTELEKHVGFKGEMQVLPEISIIPDEDPFSAVERHGRLAPMTSMDLDVAEGPEFDEPAVVDEEQTEDSELPDVDLEEFEIATRASEREVPYSETYVILKMVKPDYPAYELENGIEGSVTVELLVNESGHVETASVLSSIGPESFEASSLEAVRQFVFQPPVREGEPSSMWVRFLIKFRIYE